MGSTYDYVIVGAGSAGAVVAARLTEDPDVRVCLLEAGGAPPPAELMPAAVASLQNDPTTDWMFTGDAGGVGRGLIGGRMMVPRGKMLGGTSGINYMAYVRGHPGDFDDGKTRSRNQLSPRLIVTPWLFFSAVQPSGTSSVNDGWRGSR